MAFTPSIAILFFLVIASTMAAGLEKGQDVVVHDGQCPVNHFPNIRCRRRVCLPEELVPRCQGDNSCPSTHKCCRTMCSCTERCVESVPESTSESN